MAKQADDPENLISVHEAENLRKQVADTQDRLDSLKAEFDAAKKEWADKESSLKAEIASLTALNRTAIDHVRMYCDAAKKDVKEYEDMLNTLSTDAKEKRRKELEDQKRRAEEELNKL